MTGTYISDLATLAGQALDLSARADRLCAHLERLEDFDPEQVAEMYSILQAVGREAGSDAAEIRGMTGREGGTVHV